MMRSVAEIIKDALELPAEARAALAGSLIVSLDDAVDEDAEALWSSEIAQRIVELDDGKVQVVPWAEARRRLSGR